MINDKFHEQFYGRLLTWLQIYAIDFLGWGAVLVFVFCLLWFLETFTAGTGYLKSLG